MKFCWEEVENQFWAKMYFPKKKIKSSSISHTHSDTYTVNLPNSKVFKNCGMFFKSTVNSLISGVKNKPMHFTDVLTPSYRKQMATDGITSELHLFVPVNSKPIWEDKVKILKTTRYLSERFQNAYERWGLQDLKEY